jgi:hypothetical protein
MKEKFNNLVPEEVFLIPKEGYVIPQELAIPLIHAHEGDPGCGFCELAHDVGFIAVSMDKGSLKRILKCSITIDEKNIPKPVTKKALINKGEFERPAVVLEGLTDGEDVVYGHSICIAASNVLAKLGK